MSKVRAKTQVVHDYGAVLINMDKCLAVENWSAMLDSLQRMHQATDLCLISDQAKVQSCRDCCRKAKSAVKDTCAYISILNSLIQGQSTTTLTRAFHLFSPLAAPRLVRALEQTHLSPNSPLTSLSLCGIHITSSLLLDLCTSLTNCHELTSVNLSRTAIGDSGVQILSGYLRKLTKLTCVKLVSVGMTGKSIGSVVGWVRSRYLAIQCREFEQTLRSRVRGEGVIGDGLYLDISENALGDVGFVCFCDGMLEEALVNRLVVQNCGVTKKSMPVIAELVQNRIRIILDLSMNPIGTPYADISLHAAAFIEQAAVGAVTILTTSNHTLLDTYMKPQQNRVNLITRTEKLGQIRREAEARKKVRGVRDGFLKGQQSTTRSSNVKLTDTAAGRSELCVTKVQALFDCTLLRLQALTASIG